MEEESMSIAEIIQILKRRWILISVIIITVTISSAIVSKVFITPKYEASTKLFIGKEVGDSEKYSESDVEMYQKLMATYCETIKTRDLIEKSIKISKIEIAVGQVLSKLTVQTLPNTQILQVKLKHEDPKIAARLVEAIGEEFIKESKVLVANANTQVIESVQIPTNPVSPNVKNNVCIGFILGIMMGGTIVFLLEFLHNTYKNRRELEKETQLPVMGVITKWGKKKNKSTPMLIVDKEPKSIVSENYKTLQTNLQYTSLGKQNKTIVITSSEPGEGKSTTAGNLAIAMSQSGKSVVLLDCDLRKPSLHKKFGIPNKLGISDILIGKEVRENIGYKYNNNLIIYTAGRIPVNPVEMLGSMEMEGFLQELKETFDYVIIDTPMVQGIADTQILATKVDGVLLIVKAEKIKKDSVATSVNILKKVNSNIIGTVLNMAKIKKSSQYYNYYYGEK